MVTWGGSWAPDIKPIRIYTRLAVKLLDFSRQILIITKEWIFSQFKSNDQYPIGLWKFTRKRLWGREGTIREGKKEWRRWEMLQLKHLSRMRRCGIYIRWVPNFICQRFGPPSKHNQSCNQYVIVSVIPFLKVARTLCSEIRWILFIQGLLISLFDANQNTHHR